MFKKKKTKKVSKVKAGEPICFYEKEKLEVIKNTVVYKGIAQFCCKEMEKACTPFNTKVRERYNNDKLIFASSRIYDKGTNKIGIKTHSAYDYHSCSGLSNYHNYTEFKYCPFCGTKINGYIEVE